MYRFLHAEQRDDLVSRVYNKTHNEMALIKRNISPSKAVIFDILKTRLFQLRRAIPIFIEGGSFLNDVADCDFCKIFKKRSSLLINISL